MKKNRKKESKAGEKLEKSETQRERERTKKYIKKNKNTERIF